MDLGFAQQGWPFARSDAGVEGDGRSPFDWHGLRARFLAARASQGALQGEFQTLGTAAGNAISWASGSFDARAARLIAGYGDGQPDVNPNALANGKGAQAKELPPPATSWPVIEGNDD